MALALSLESAFLVLSLRGKSFTLTAPEASVTLGEPESPPAADGTKTRRNRLQWKYHAAYDDAFDLGPLGGVTDVIREVGAMLPAPPPGAASTTVAQLESQWSALKDKLGALPVLSNAAENVLSTIEHTSVKITDLVLELDLVTKTTPGAGGTTSTTTGGGAFSLGLAFTPSATQPIRLFALGITAFGAVLAVKLEKLKLVGSTVPGGSGSLEFEA